MSDWITAAMERERPPIYRGGFPTHKHRRRMRRRRHAARRRQDRRDRRTARTREPLWLT